MAELKSEWTEVQPNPPTFRVELIVRETYPRTREQPENVHRVPNERAATIVDIAKALGVNERDVRDLCEEGTLIDAVKKRGMEVVHVDN